MGKRASDIWQVPLCGDHHREIHKAEEKFQLKYGLNLKDICRELVRSSPSEKAKKEMRKHYEVDFE